MRKRLILLLKYLEVYKKSPVQFPNNITPVIIASAFNTKQRHRILSYITMLMNKTCQISKNDMINRSPCMPLSLCLCNTITFFCLQTKIPSFNEHPDSPLSTCPLSKLGHLQIIFFETRFSNAAQTQVCLQFASPWE